MSLKQFFGPSKRKFVVTGIIFLLSVSIFYILSWKCEFQLFNVIPSSCYYGFLPVSVKAFDVLNLGFILPSFISGLFSTPIYIATTLQLTVVLVAQLLYTYLLACIYVNRKEISNKIPPIRLFLKLFLVVYLAWIVIFNMPNELRRTRLSEEITAVITFNEDGGAVVNYKPLWTLLPYSLIWPIDTNPRFKTTIAEQSHVVGRQLLPPLLTTFIIFLLFFRRSKRS